jgi:hypothetical protein
LTPTGTQSWSTNIDERSRARAQARDPDRLARFFVRVRIESANRGLAAPLPSCLVIANAVMRHEQPSRTALLNRVALAACRAPDDLLE